MSRNGQVQLPGDGTPGRPRRTFRIAVLIGVLALVGSAIALGTLPLSLRTSFGDIASVPAAAVAALACAVRASRAVRAGRLAWALLAAACLSWTVAETIWAVWSDRGDASSLPWLDDVFYLLGLPFGIAALALLPGSRWRGRDRLRSVLDGLIIGSAALFVFRGLGLLARGEGPLFDQLANLTYPVGDLIMLTIALTVVLRADRSISIHLLLLVGASASYVVGDSVYAIQIAQDRYRPGTLLDLTWLVSYVLFALAALAPDSGREVAMRDRPVYEHRFASWLLLGGAMLAAAVVAVWGPVRLAEDRLMLGTGFCVLLLFALRQGWLAYDASRLNQALAQQVQRIDEIGEAVIDGVMVADRTGRITSGNETAQQLLGRESLVGLSLFDLLVDRSDEPTTELQVVDAIRRGERLVGVETAFCLADGGELPVEVTIGPLRQNSRPAGTVVVFRDVSARHAVDKVKREFLSVVSHELRTPLASIRGALALVNGGVDGDLGPHSARMISIALISSERLSRLLDDILDIERLARGRLQLSRSDFAACDLVAVAANEMGVFAAQQEVALRVRETPGTVFADRDRVLQVLVNLLNNAIKFSAPGTEVVVSTQIVGGTVEFSVADQGRGIPADHLELIFEPFEQVDSSDSREINGTGLGLAICRDLVQLHGGRIWATTTPGVGSEFRFTLPAAAAEAAPTLEPARSAVA